MTDPWGNPLPEDPRRAPDPSHAGEGAGAGGPEPPRDVGYWPGSPADPHGSAGTPTPYGYGPPPYGPDGRPQQSPRRDGTAVGALVAGVSGLLCGLCGAFGVVVGPVAIVLGLVSRRRIRGSGGQLQGWNLATGGLALGVVGTLASLAWIAFLAANPEIFQDLMERFETTTTTVPE